MEQQTRVDIKPKITRASFRLSALENLKEATEDTRKSSEKLKRIFERNTYQKKTQLTVLKRYKRRLDAIEREEESRRKRSARKKIKLPQLKKFAGSFFAPGASKDPMKALAVLSAFKTATNVSEGKWFDAFLSGLTTAGLVAGPALLGLGLNSMFGDRGAKPRGGRRVPRVTGDTGRFNLRNPFRRGPRVTGDNGGLNIRNPLRRRPKITGDAGGFSRIGKAFGRFGKSAIPIAGAALGAADAAIRVNEGDVTGASIAGASASLDAISAGLTATGIGVLPAAALSAVSFGLDLVNLVRDLSGASDAEAKRNKQKKNAGRPGETDTQRRLREETEKQKDLANQKRKGNGTLTFASTLNGYERVITKFEKFSREFKIGKQFDLYAEVSPTDYREDQEDTFDSQDFGQLGGTFESHILEFREFRNKQFGASKERFATASPRLYQIRELGIWEGGKQDNWRINPLADDTAYEKDAHKGAGHWENRAFDIPVPESSREGDMVAEFWRKRGYKVLWRVSGHYTHVHVEVPKEKANEFFSGKLSGQRPREPQPTQRPPTPPSPTPPPNPAARPKKEKATIDGFVYEMKNGKYYENGKEIEKQLYDAVKKNHRNKFKVISSVDENKNGAIIAFNPQSAAQMQPQQNISQGSSTIILNSNKSKIEEVFTYNQFLNA